MAAEGEEENGRRRVMVAIDESECSRYALEWALHHLAQPFASSPPLLLFTVQPINTLGYIPAVGYGSTHALAAVPPAPGLIKSLQEHRKKVALALLESAEELCAKKGVGEPASAYGEFLICNSHN